MWWKFYQELTGAIAGIVMIVGMIVWVIVEVVK